MDVYPQSLVKNSPGVEVSKNANAPTVTPAFKHPHEVMSLVATASASVSADLEVQLKVGVAEAGPFAIPLDTGGIPVPPLKFAAAKTTIAGPIITDTVSAFPWAILEILNTSQANGSSWKLTDLSLVRGA